MLNLIFLLLTIGVFAIMNIIFLPIIFIAGLFSKKAKYRIAQRIVKDGFRYVLFMCGIRTKVIGLENIPKDEAVLFVGNHNSILDILIAYPRMKGITGFVAKSELSKIKGLAMWMGFMQCVFIDRDDMKASLKAILTCIDHVKEGTSIAIFPEGTRSKDGNMLPFKDGSFKIAAKTGCKIVPFVQNNTRSAFEAQAPKIRSTKTVLEFCEPIDLSTLSDDDRKHIGAYVQNIMTEVYNRNQALIEKK